MADSNDTKLFWCKRIFKSGTVLTSLANINAFYTTEFDETLVGLFTQVLRRSQVPIGTNMLLLREGIVRTMFCPGSDFLGLQKELASEICYRYLQTLSTNQQGKPTYITIFVSPHYNELALRAYLGFADEDIVKSDSTLDIYNVTPKVQEYLKSRKDKRIAEILNQAKKHGIKK